MFLKFVYAFLKPRLWKTKKSSEEYLFDDLRGSNVARYQTSFFLRLVEGYLGPEWNVPSKVE